MMLKHSMRYHRFQILFKAGTPHLIAKRELLLGFARGKRVLFTEVASDNDAVITW